MGHSFAKRDHKVSEDHQNHEVSIGTADSLAWQIVKIGLNGLLK